MNQELIELGRERTRRRGLPGSATTTTSGRRPINTIIHGLANLKQQINSATVLKATGYIVLAWMVIAYANQSECGCGPRSLESMMDKVTKSFNKKEQSLGVGAGEKQEQKSSLNLEDLEGIVSLFEAITNHFTGKCNSPINSAVCTTACAQSGDELQRQMWSNCFRGWFRGEDASRSSYSSSYPFKALEEVSREVGKLFLGEL